MTVTLSDWRCSQCGTTLLDRITVRQGWVEVKCRKCEEINLASVTTYKTPTITMELRDPRHLIGVASQDWQGEITTYCRKCRATVTLPEKRHTDVAA